MGRPLYYNHAKESSMSGKELKHLLLVTPGFPESEADTTCIPALQQFVLSYKRLHPELKITILSLHYPFHKSSYQWHDMDVYCMTGKNKHGFTRLRTMYRAYKKGRAIHRAAPTDVVLSIWVTDAALAAKHIARKLHVPFFAWIWGQDVKPGNKYMKLVNPAPEHLAVMSEYQNDILKQSYGIKAKYVIPNAIIEDVFPVFNTGERSIDLLAVGSLIPLKQYHLFIELVKWQKENGHPHIKAVLAGDGPLKNELVALQKKYSLENNLTITGAVPHNEIYNLMNNAKVFVHPSNYEGHSTVILEALYSGCHVVSFMPIATTPVENFTQCSNTDEMQIAITHTLVDPTAVKRILYSTWQQNVTQLHKILQLLR
jgi:glycosyltransferase involved in cell wall biosynthesis